MTLRELQEMCERTERIYAEKGLPGEPGFQVAVHRACKGKRVRVVPGPRGGVHLYGDVVHQGTGKGNPTIAIVKCKDVHTFFHQFEEVGV